VHAAGADAARHAAGQLARCIEIGAAPLPPLPVLIERIVR
jgi:hypothetical protein